MFLCENGKEAFKRKTCKKRLYNEFEEKRELKKTAELKKSATSSITF